MGVLTHVLVQVLVEFSSQIIEIFSASGVIWLLFTQIDPALEAESSCHPMAENSIAGCCVDCCARSSVSSV